MPGRRDAGRIWQVRLDQFLVRYGMRQMHSDRRVWVYASELGILMIHDHVDDTRMTYTDDRARDHFYLHCVAARYARPEALTDLAFAAIVRVAHYLVATKHLSLTISPSPHGVGDLLRGYCDASHGNGERGSSYAGAGLLSAGGGAIAWKCISSVSGDDAPGSMELRMVVTTYK